MLLTSPAITLPSITASQRLRVNFWAWIDVYFMYPRGDFLVSSDGTTWVTVAELLGTMNGTWSNYDFDVSSYAGGQIYLRFAMLNAEYSYPGFYVDDVKITQYDAPAQSTTLTLTAWEDTGTGASCPWVFSRTSSGFIQDNDIYSTAQGQSAEYTDYYNLNNQPIQVNGQYQLNLQEITQETSYTDFVQLLAVDHSSATRIASDENGNILTYSNPVAPISAIDGKGNDVLNQITTQDGSGVKVYNGDTITLNFANVDTSKGATLVLRAQGFLDDGDPGASTGAPPRIFVQTQDAQGNWITRNSFYPRNNFAIAAYDLSQYLGTSKQVRLCSTSCLTGKYHLIDYVGLDNSSQASTIIQTLSPVTAVHSVNGDVLSKLANADGQYASMCPGETISLAFTAPVLKGEVRDFVLVTKGYYIPTGTFFVYTWDGSSWVERDGWSIPKGGSNSIDYTHTFDLSLALPDPNGQFRVRIWQDYMYESASVNYVGLTYAGVAGNLTGAYDLKSGTDVTLTLNQTDSLRDYWYGAYNGPRDRWVEANFTVAGYTIVPPVITQVEVTNTQTANPTISWTYTDANGLPQAGYQVEVWEGPGGSGKIMWNPPAGTGTTNTTVYAGLTLNSNQTYYVQVKAYDGTVWGFWTETSFTTPVPTVIVSPASWTMDVGQSQLFTATPSGGSGTIHYQWYLDGSAVGSDSSTYTFSKSAGSYSVTCKVTDSADTPVTSPASNAVSVTVNPTSTPTPTPTATPQPLTATTTSSSGTSVTVTAGNSVTYTATVSGGAAPYHYQWVVYVSPNSTVNGWLTGQTSTKLNASQTVPGTYTYFLLVFDASGQVTTSNRVTLTVTQSSPTPSPTPTPTPTLTPTATPIAFVFSAVDWLIVVIVIIIVLILIILAWYRRRRNLTVTVQNSQTLSPISGASVSASGPKPLSGTTGSNGQIVFSNVKAGNYAIKASATGYNSSIPVSVSVKNNTKYVIKLDSIASETQETQTK
jgi:hypothetical protein